MRIAAIIFAVLFSASLGADSVSVPNTLSNNTPADADDVQENFQALVEESNENDQRIADAEDSIGTLESYFPSDQTKYVSSSGWYTIAYIPCSSVVGGSCTYDVSGKGSAYFIIRSDTGPKHQTTVLYASAIFGMVQLQVLHNQIYSQQPFTAARIRDGGAYHGALLQIQVDTTANISLTARLASREQEGSDSYAMPGWIQTNWTPDGDTLDSIDYTLLTTEAMREIPTEVQYLSEFSCTAGQILEWNNTRSQWECADKQALPSRLMWVDSDGDRFYYDGSTNLKYVFPESDIVFNVYQVTNGNYDVNQIRFSDRNCGAGGGSAYLAISASAGDVNHAGRGNGVWYVPDNTQQPISINFANGDWSALNQNGCSLETSGTVTDHYPASQSTEPYDLDIDPPLTLQQVQD